MKITHEQQVNAVNMAANCVGAVVNLKFENQALTAALRDELLKKSLAGEHVELTMSVDAYQQEYGKQNRNFVRIHDQDMNSFAASGKTRPFMRDHKQGDMTAKAGHILKGDLEELGAGKFNVKLDVVLRAPWAVQMALHGLLDTVSVSWRSRSRTVKCSACDAQVFTQCWHCPGEKLRAVNVDGKTKFTYDPKGDVICEWIYYDPEMLECSIVPVPAVPTSRVSEIRAALGFDLSDADPVTPTQEPPQENMTMKTEQEIAALEAREQRLTKIVSLTRDEREFFETLKRDDQEDFLNMSRKDRGEIMTPVYTSSQTGAKFYATDDQRTIDQVKASDAAVADMKKQVDAARASNLASRAETELAHLAGTTEVRAAILSAVDNIEKPEIREAALKAIKEYDAKQSSNFQRQGGTGARPAATVAAEEKIQQLADKYEEEHDVSAAEAYNHVMNTAEGQKLYAEMEAAKRRSN